MVQVVIGDRPASWPGCSRSAEEAGVNIEDVRLEHAPGLPLGVAELSVQPEAAAGCSPRPCARAAGTCRPDARAPRAHRAEAGCAAAHRVARPCLRVTRSLVVAVPLAAVRTMALKGEAVTGLVVAMDGPSGSGKSSASRGVARALGLRYLDTGAMYRAITWWMLQQGVDSTDPAGDRGPRAASR